MTDAARSHRWEKRYRDGDLPWDSGRPCHELAGRLPWLDLAGDKAVEFGCGTGTNALFMAAAHGLDVVGMDLSATAVQQATHKALAQGIDRARFVTADVLLPPPVRPGQFALAYDRGCLHSVAPEDRATFASRVADCLAPGGYWITLAGNADEARGPDQEGPPQMQATDLLAAAEPRFAILELRRSAFRVGGRPMAWFALMQRR
jgi:SAM-dependent methyltransferase